MPRESQSIRVEPWFAIVCIPSVNDPMELPTYPFHLLSSIFVLGSLPAFVFTIAVAIKNWWWD